MKRSITGIARFTLLGCALVGVDACLPSAFSQEATNRGSGTPKPRAQSGLAEKPMFLPFAQFQIPFNVDSAGKEPALVQLWVSTDDGQTWQMHGSAKPDARHFDFRAAAEGLYLFSVHTVDATGAAFPSEGPPLRVHVDTTKPNAAIRADIDGAGNLVVDIRVIDDFVDLTSATLRIRTDRQAAWRDIPVESLHRAGDLFEGKAVVPISPCREVAIVFSIKDEANNSGEASFKLAMPRTAAGDQDMKLASTGTPTNGSGFLPTSKLKPIDGATPWDPTPGNTAQATSEPPEPLQQESPKRGPGKLIGTNLLNLDRADNVEELPLPMPEGGHPVDAPRTAEPGNLELPDEVYARSSSATDDRPIPPAMGQAYHCKSRAFSLDYSVETLGGSTLSDVELWGTEDGGRSWSMWGSDPDRQSPFDVQVGNDGLFGFRMVIVGSNGIVSNRPKDGDTADVWINIDTALPTAKITRAVYGEGAEDGLLVIDYNCDDRHLVDRPITLSFSERTQGPWTTIAAGLNNTGTYLWKPDPKLPERVYLRMEAVDKAGNIGTHRLELPVEIKGLAPRGRIQGFRPIMNPQDS